MSDVQAIHSKALPDIFRRDLDADAVKGMFRETLGKQGHTILVAEDAGQPVDYIWSEIFDRPANFYHHPHAPVTFTISVCPRQFGARASAARSSRPSAPAWRTPRDRRGRRGLLGLQHTCVTVLREPRVRAAAPYRLRSGYPCRLERNAKNACPGLDPG